MLIDPYQEAERMGITIAHVPLSGNILGVWTGRQILITPSLKEREERCVLAHELIHAKYDLPFIHKWLSPKAEARADRLAAEMLIDPMLYTHYCKYLDLGELAIELGVTGKILTAYIKTHPEQTAHAA